MNTAQRTAIAGPATGLMVYDTDLASLVYYSGANWQVVSAGSASSLWTLTNGNDITNTNLGRIGIGLANPLARFAIDSGLVVDQSNSNDPSLTGRNNGIFFGNPALAGITSNKQNGTSTRSGLSFYTGGARRMIIDSVGRMAIGTLTDPNFQVVLSGSLGNMYISGGLSVFSILNRGDMVVDDRLAVNSDGIGSAALRIKGRLSTPDNWGQHLMLVATSSADSGAILYDGDGIKMRTFDAGDGFFFRNAANQTTLSVSEDGNVSARGEITSLNRGVVLGNDGNSHQIRYFTSSFSPGFGFSLGSGVSVQLGVNFNLGFSDLPFVIGAELVGCTVSSGVIRRVILNPISTTTTSASFEIVNAGSGSVVCSNCQIRMALVGPR